MKKYLLLLLGITGISSGLGAQRHLNSGYRFEAVPDEIIHIRFDRPLGEWQGFGVNYVESAQTRDYSLYQQDYSVVSFASEESRQQVMEMIFGKDGLRPGLTKLFPDPFHEGLSKDENDNKDPMRIRYFNREGLKMMNQWGGSFTSIATLYGPVRKHILRKTIIITS